MFRPNKPVTKTICSPYIPDGLFSLGDLVLAEAQASTNHDYGISDQPVDVTNIKSPLDLIDDLESLLPKTSKFGSHTRVIEWLSPKIYKDWNNQYASTRDSVSIQVNDQPFKGSRKRPKQAPYDHTGKTIIRATHARLPSNEDDRTSATPISVQYTFPTLASADQYPDIQVDIQPGISWLSLPTLTRDYFDAAAGIGFCVNTLLRQTDDLLVLSEELRRAAEDAS